MTDRDLDLLIRDRVFAFKWDEERCRVCAWPFATTYTDDGHPEGCAPGNCSLRPAPEIPAADRVAPYSTDIAAAFSVVEEMRRREYDVRITAKDYWHVLFQQLDEPGAPEDGSYYDESHPRHVAESCVDPRGLPHTICLAALRALGEPEVRG